MLQKAHTLAISEKLEHKRTLFDWPIGIVYQFYILMMFKHSLETQANMETWEKVTTRSQVSVYRTNYPMVTIAAIDPKHDQDGRYTHLWLKKKINKNKSLCPVTILVASQVSDRCPWATCLRT